MFLNKSGSHMELQTRQVNPMPPEPPKVFSDKVKEETEKIKKQMGLPGNLQEQSLKMKPIEERKSN
jgi:hypothetical protein